MFIHPLLVNQWQSWLIVLVVVLVLFGATRLPALSKSLGQSIKIFRKEMSGDEAKPAADGTQASESADTDSPTPSDRASTPTDKS